MKEEGEGKGGENILGKGQLCKGPEVKGSEELKASGEDRS